MLFLGGGVGGETGSHYVVLAVLEIAMWTRLALNSWRSSCLCLSGALGLKVHAAMPGTVDGRAMTAA